MVFGIDARQRLPDCRQRVWIATAEKVVEWVAKEPGIKSDRVEEWL